MPITLTCACGKQLRVADEQAGKTVKCPTCGATQTVRRPAFGHASAPRPAPPQPAAPPAAAQPATKQPAEQPAGFDDFEVVEEAPPLATAPKPRARVKAVAEEEPAADPPPAPAKARKKKKKRKKGDAAEGEEGDDWYEKAREREAWMKRVVRGTAYIVLGSLIVIGVAIAFLVYSAELQEVGGKAVGGMIIFGLFGVAAIGKGVIGLVFGQFLGDDD